MVARVVAKVVLITIDVLKVVVVDSAVANVVVLATGDVL